MVMFNLRKQSFSLVTVSSVCSLCLPATTTSAEQNPGDAVLKSAPSYNTSTEYTKNFRILGKFLLTGLCIYLFVLISTRFFAKEILKKKIKKLERVAKECGVQKIDLQNALALSSKKYAMLKTSTQNSSVSTSEEYATLEKSITSSSEDYKRKSENLIKKFDELEKRTAERMAELKKVLEELNQKIYLPGISVIAGHV